MGEWWHLKLYQSSEKECKRCTQYKRWQEITFFNFYLLCRKSIIAYILENENTIQFHLFQTMFKLICESLKLLPHQQVKKLSLTLIANRPWDYPENFGVYSQLNRKSKTFFYFPQCVCFLNPTGQNPNLTLLPQNSGILQTRMGQRGNLMKMNFDNFQMQK